MLNVACVRWGAMYGPEYVRNLQLALSRHLTVPFQLHCFTDEHVSRIEARFRGLPGQHSMTGHPIAAGTPPLNGWWNKLWMFNKGAFASGERVIFFDLDTVILRNIDALAECDSDFACLRDFYRPLGLGSGVMLWEAGKMDYVWDQYVADGYPELQGGDQAYIEQVVGRRHAALLQDLYPGMFASYKADGLAHDPGTAAVVCFHGQPKPHNCGSLWVAEHWGDSSSVPGAPPKHFVSSLAQEIQALPNTDSEVLCRNIETNSRRNLKWLKEAPEHDGIAVIVGGGPSLGSSFDFVRGHQQAGHKIFALNNAANFLFARLVIAEWQLIIDPRPENVRFLEERAAHKYILASQCDPGLFDVLRDEEVLVLHTATEGVREHIPPGSTATLVGGGVTAGLTAIAAAYTLGFRTIHLYGYDSSDAEDGNAHAYPQNENDPEKKRIDVWCAGRKFRSSYAMYKQAELFQGFAQLLADAGATIYVHGDGLLPTIAREMSKAQAA